MKPDLYSQAWMEDCIDQVGSAKFVNKFDLLKGYWQVPLTKRATEISAFIIWLVLLHNDAILLTECFCYVPTANE